MDNPLFLLDRLNPFDGSRNLEYCRQKATCQTLNYTTCLGAKLPYTQTTLELVPNLETQERILVSSLRLRCLHFSLSYVDQLFRQLTVQN